MDIRHLQDLAELASSPEGIDWEQLRAVMADRTGRKALIVQAKALEDLFGVPIPPELHAGRTARLRHVGRLIAASQGSTGSAARLIGNASRGLNRLGAAYAWKNGLKFPQKVYRRLASPGKGARR